MGVLGAEPPSIFTGKLFSTHSSMGGGPGRAAPPPGYRPLTWGGSFFFFTRGGADYRSRQAIQTPNKKLPPPSYQSFLGEYLSFQILQPWSLGHSCFSYRSHTVYRLPFLPFTVVYRLPCVTVCYRFSLGGPCPPRTPHYGLRPHNMMVWLRYQAVF